MSRWMHIFIAVIFGSTTPVQSNAGETPVSSHRILLYMTSPSGSGEVDDDPALTATDLSKQIGDLGVAVKVTKATTDSDPISQIGAVRSNPENEGAVGGFSLVKTDTGMRFHLVLFDAESEWSVVRRLDALDTETLIETLGVIIRTSLTVFMTDLDHRVESPPEPPPPPSGSPPPAPPEKAKGRPVSPFYRFALGAAYDVCLNASEIPPIHGVGFDAVVYAHRRVRLYAGYVVSFPQRIAQADTVLRSVHHPAEVGALVDTAWKRFHLLGGIGFGVNYITHEYNKDIEGRQTLDQQGYLQLSVVPILALEVMTVDQLGVTFAARADVLLRRPRYLSSRDDGIGVIADPWPVTLSIALGLTWHFFKVKP